MDKIDYRHHYILVVDTETANTFSDGKKLDYSSGLVYDCGFAVVDTKGRVYETYSFVNSDIFGIDVLMQSAYYANKIPLYWYGLDNGSRIMADTYTIRQTMLAVMEKYRINEVCAHNARFDVAVLNSTIRYTTKSKIRYWFPYGVEIWDSMKMARSVIHKMATYRKFCEKNDLLTATGRLSTTAENLYRFITKNVEFVEAHTGLEDVSIEMQIIFYCYRQHKKMDKVLYPVKNNEITEFQKNLLTNLRKYATIRMW